MNTLEESFEVCEVIQSVTEAFEHISPPNWLIHRFIECQTLGQIYAGWNVGKSALAVDLACRVATGLDFVGRKIGKGPVLYISSEGSRGLIRRFEGWSQFNNIALPTSIYTTIVPTRLPDPDTQTKLKAAYSHIFAVESDFPRLVVVDTLAQTMVGDQNSTTDVDRFTALLRKLFQYSTVLLLHHVGHGEKTRSRGASSLPAACDWEFQLEELKEKSDDPDFIKYIRLKNTKQRDEEQQMDICFSLKKFELDTDTDHEPYTTVVLSPLVQLIDSPKSSVNWGAKTQEMLGILDLMKNEEQEKLITAGQHPEWAQVRVSDWRLRCLDSGIKADTFRKAKQRLIRSSEIDLNKEYVART